VAIYQVTSTSINSACTGKHFQQTPRAVTKTGAGNNSATQLGCNVCQQLVKLLFLPTPKKFCLVKCFNWRRFRTRPP